MQAGTASCSMVCYFTGLPFVLRLEVMQDGLSKEKACFASFAPGLEILAYISLPSLNASVGKVLEALHLVPYPLHNSSLFSFTEKHADIIINTF